MNKFGRHRLRVFRSREFHLLGECVVFEPIEQRVPQAAEDSELRVMDVCIHETRQQEAAAKIARPYSGVGSSQSHIISTGCDAPIFDQQTTIGERFERVLVPERISRSMEDRRTQQFGGGVFCHARAAPRGCSIRDTGPARARSTAQKTLSGVSGLSTATTPPPPNAAIASRKASRTEMPSINGGSPTALLPRITDGSVARSRKLTSNTSGISDQEGTL